MLQQTIYHGFTLSTKYRRQLISKFLSFRKKKIFDIFILQIFAQMSNCWSWLKSWKDSWLEENYHWCLQTSFITILQMQRFIGLSARTMNRSLSLKFDWRHKKAFSLPHSHPFHFFWNEEWSLRLYDRIWRDY